MKWISGPKQYLYFLESREPRFHSRMRPFFLFWPFSIWDSRREKKKVSFLIAVYHSMVNGWLGDDVLKLTQKTVPFETCENERVLGSIWYLNSTLKTMFFKKFFQWGEKCLNLDLLIIAALKTQLHNFAFYFSGAQALLVVSHVQNRMKTSTVNLCLFPSAMNGNPWSFLYRVFLLCSCCYFAKNLQSLILCISSSSWRETTLENIMARWSQDARILQMFAENYWKMLQFDKSRKC